MERTCVSAFRRATKSSLIQWREISSNRRCVRWGRAWCTNVPIDVARLGGSHGRNDSAMPAPRQCVAEPSISGQGVGLGSAATCSTRPRYAFAISTSVGNTAAEFFKLDVVLPDDLPECPGNDDNGQRLRENPDLHTLISPITGSDALP